VSESKNLDAAASASELSPEAAAVMNSISEELASNRPITAPITFNWLGDAVQAETAAEIVQVQAILLRRRHPWLSFDSLESILFHHDYPQALRDLSERLGRKCEATVDDSGSGFAMVVPVGSSSVAVFDARIAYGFFEDSSRSMCLDILEHELCHVFDFARKNRLLESHPLQLEGLAARFFSVADSAWSEFFANRYSDSSHGSPTAHPELLAEIVPSLKREVREEIVAYRTHKDLNRLLAQVEAKVGFLFQCFGYAAGRLQAHGTTLPAVAPDSSAALEDAGLTEVWDGVTAELARLDSTRDSWTSLSELATLMDYVRLTMNSLGLNYSHQAEGVHVEVPFTSDTMPILNPLGNALANLFVAFRKQ